MKVAIAPSRRIQGEVVVPGDKSLSHRALMFAALGRGASVLDHLGTGADVASTARCLRTLGVAVETGDGVRIEGLGYEAWRGMVPSRPLDCGNSGTTMRLLSGLLAGAGIHATLMGDEGLSRRPMARVLRPLLHMGARCHGRQEGDRQLPPLVFEGGALVGRHHDLPIASAQVKSCILLAGLFAEGTTSVREPGDSRDHTERLLAALGARIEREERSVVVEPLAAPLAALGEVRIPGDPSSAAFFVAAASLVEGGRLRLPGVSTNPTRAGFLRVLQRMGARIEVAEGYEVLGEPAGDVHVRGTGELSATAVDADEVPALVDEIPLLAVVATQSEGATTIRGAGELRVKESDRLAVTAAGLRALGADVDELDDGLIIRGPTRLSGGHIDSAGDHRIAMSFAIAGLVAHEPVVIDGAEWVDISFPGFFEHLARLSGSVELA